VRVTTVDLLKAPQEQEPARPSVITIGSFDGVHRGHRYLIGEVADRARSKGCEAAVVTFDPLPAQVIRPESAPRSITDLDEKLSLLAGPDVDMVVVLPFTHELSRLPAGDFLDRLLACVRVAEIWCGADFAFGHGREGDVAFLAGLAGPRGYGLHVVPRINHDGRRISSSEARSLISEGRVREAGDLLGHPPGLPGIVESGAGRGRGLGYPTANLRISPAHIIPATGIYAGFAHLGEERLEAAISIGHSPTFGQNPLTVEAHLLDFDRDIVGREIKLELVERLRGEERFAGSEALIAQMDRDVEQVRQILGSCRSAAAV